MVAVNDTYRTYMGDANVLVSIDKITDETITGHVVNEPIERHGVRIDSDFAGQVVSDTLVNVEGMIRHEEALQAIFARNRKASAAALASIPDGSTVHQWVAEGQFYRGALVRDASGKAMIQVSALVGGWPADSVTRDRFGEVQAPLAVRAALEKMTRPCRADHLYESTSFVGEKTFDPREAPEFDLTPPELTRVQETDALIERLLRSVRFAASDYDLPPAERLEAVKNIIG